MDYNEAMMEALHVFTLRIHAIYSTPRLPRPVWSSLTTVSSQSSPPWKGADITIKCFISELARMVNQHNTKQKNFFMSGLITSVLTHHLGWVNTTLPSNNSEQNSKTVAYNPLWAQLGDLYGAVGSPTKVVKTVVIGEIHELVSTIISILSYFIRCSNIDEVMETPADMTPQAFSDDHTSLSMSYISSDLETSDYVLVTVEDGDVGKPVEHDSENELSNTEPPNPKTKPQKFSSCRRNENSEPISVKKQEKDSLETSNGSTLCRGRSSPGTTVKPQIKVVNRQKSSGNFENLPSMRHRTNSNDTFARPRGVQSRRTSREASQRMSQSSSALVIPNSEKSDNTVSSLEGSKSLCLAPTPTTDKLRKKLGNENMGSCPKDFAGNVKTPAAATSSAATCGHQSAKPPLPAQRQRLRTHKRVSSEPFNINNLKSESATSTSLVKTKSTNFPIVRQMFVERIEPKVINVAHVQRSQHMITAPSPLSSPCLPRSKSSSSGQKGPIMGFKTNDAIESPRRTTRLKHSSGSALQDRQTDKSPTIIEDRDVFSPKKPDLQITSTDLEHSKSFDFNNAGVQRSSSNTSTGSTVRRSSSASSGKVRLAGRRRNLADSSKALSIDEGDESIPDLPPLERIPSISLEHDEFDKYFNKDAERDEYIFFSTLTQSHSSMTNSIKHKEADQSSNTEAKQPPSVPSVPPCGSSKTLQCLTKSQSTVTKSVNQKAENRSRATKNVPPPLPSVGPCHRSLSTKSEHAEKMITSPIKATPKSAPPLPAAPPVHRGSLYPKLDEIITPNVAKPFPKTSIYPNLDETPERKPQSTRIYPKLDEPPPYSPFPEGTLYPRLSESSQIESASGEEEDSESAEYFAIHEEVALRAVELSDKVETKRSDADADKPTKLSFGELLADYSPEYLWGFALHGTRNQPNFYMNVIHELQHSVSRPVLDEPVAEAVSIVADTDKWSVRVLSSHRIHSDKIALPALNSKLVTDMLERIMKLYQMSVPAEFCMQQLESSLGELVLKSRMLAGYVTGNTRVTMSQLSAVLGIGSSDLPLLMAIASCHSPQVAVKLL